MDKEKPIVIKISEIRTFLKQRGYAISNRGRIQAGLLDEFFRLNPQYTYKTVVSESGEILKQFIPITGTTPASAPSPANPSSPMRLFELQEIPVPTPTSPMPMDEDADADERIKIEFYYPDPFTPSEDIRHFYVAV